MEFEDTPLFDWLKKNRLFMLILVVGILAIAANERFGPSLRNSALVESWTLFQQVTTDLKLDENLESSLQLARSDERIFPWVVFGATKVALLQRDANALQTLRPELESLNQGDAAQWKISSENGAISIASFLLERVTEMEAGGTKVFENPQPTGPSVRFVVTNSLETTYEFTVGLFEAAAPLATEIFLAAVEGGTLVGSELQNFGGRSLKLEGLNANSPPELERDFGYFHLAGSLSFVQKPGAPGEQETDAIQLMLEDNTFADGQSTVFGVITEGFDGLKSAITGEEDPEVSFTVTSTTIL